MGLIIKSKKIILSFLVTVIMATTFMSTFQLSASAESVSTPKSGDSKVGYNALVIDKIIPEAVDINEAKEKKHVNRLLDKEDSLDKIVYANEDGSETTYLFHEPVKYKDENGIIKDKSNKLSKVGTNNNFYKNLKDTIDYSYVNAENDINTYFPTKISNKKGIKLASSDISISMYPSTSSESNVVEDNNVIYYDNVFGEYTSLRYKTIFTGFKEDIVLEKYVGNTFKFIIDAGGLIPSAENGSIQLKNDKGEVCAELSPIYVYSISKEESKITYDNQLEYTKLEGDRYEILITVDDMFLKDPNTVYPVYVDPTVTISSSGSGSSKSIIDTPIYNGSGVSNITGGVNPTAIIGRVNSTYGSGRLLMRFPGLMEENFMEDSTITSAKLIMNEVSGFSASSKISAYNYTGPDWNESTRYSSSAWNGVGSFLDYWYFNYPNNTTKSFNILSAVKVWQSDPDKGEKGIILKNNTSESDYSKTKIFGTSEGAAKPYLSVTYFYGARGYWEIPYKSPDYDNVNCLHYAFGIADTFGNRDNIEKLDKPSVTLSEALYTTKNEMESWLAINFPNRWREVSSYKAQLYSNEWLVAMRVGVGKIAPNKYYDYHFWYRASNGNWYSKFA